MIFPDRLDQVGTWSDAAGAERMESFAQPPAVVAPFGDEVDLFVEILTHIGGPQRPGLAVEAHAPYIPQPPGPGFRPRVLVTHERIVLGDGVALARILVVHIDAEDLG